MGTILFNLYNFDLYITYTYFFVNVNQSFSITVLSCELGYNPNDKLSGKGYIVGFHGQLQYGHALHGTP